jgi:hypothetical protein
MAFWSWSWSVINDDGTLTALPGACLQGGSQSSVKQNLTDPITVATAQLYGRRPDLMPTITVGMGIRVTATNGANTSGFNDMRVTNYVVDYGIVSAEDRWTMQLEDTLAPFGRAQVSLSFTAGQKTGNAAADLGLEVGVEKFAITPEPTLSTVSAQTFTNENAMDILRKLGQTENGSVYALGAELYPGLGATVWSFYFGARNGNQTPSGLFTDGSVTAANNATNFRYDRLEFAGIADDYAETVIVEPAGLAAQTAGAGSRTYSFQSYDQTTTQAAGNAGYVQAELDAATQGPRSLSFTWEQQGGYYKTYGSLITIEFRGTTYYAQVLGGTQTFTPEGTRVTLNLVSSDAVSWLTLGNSIFGRLDYNRLSY